MTTDNNNINNQKYLEICNQFNEIMKGKDKELIQVKKKYNDFYKNLISIFGIIRLIRDEIDLSDNFEIEAILYKVDFMMNDLLFNHLYKIDDD